MLHGGMVEKWDPFPGLLGTPQNPWDSRVPLGPSRPLAISGTPQNPLGRRESPWNYPGTTGIPWDVMREKDFSGIIIRLLYLRNYNFSIIKFSPANTSNR